jgi:hypothetical protein
MPSKETAQKIPGPEILSPSKEPLRIRIENVAEAIVATSTVGISVQTESVKPQLHIPFDPDYPQRLGFLDGKFDFQPAESPEDPDLLIGEVTESSFGDYKNNKKQDATPLGGAGVVLILKDEQKPGILIGIRGPLNRSYSKQLTLTSVAGMMDVNRDEETGLIPPLTDELIDNTFIREGEEEIGLDPKKIIVGGMKRIAFIEDLKKPHGELGLLVEVDQTVDELEKKVAQNTSKIDFAERFVEVEGDPLKAIEKIATEGDPIPPTHLLVGLAAGFNIAMKHYNYSESQARDWVARMEKGARENAQRNDLLIQEHWSERPLTAKLGRWRAGRDGVYKDDITHTPNTEGYDPDYPNTYQGFAPEYEVLHRLGLIKENEEKPLPRPTFAINAYFDGVLLDINTKKMEQPSIADNIVKLLQQGAIFGGEYRSGSAEHAEKEVLDKLEAIIDKRGISRKYLDRIFVVCEKGGVVIRYEDGERQRFVRPDLAASENFNQVRNGINNLLNTNEELARFNSNDSDKKTMVTFEKSKAPDGIDPEEWQKEFKLQQEKLVPLLNEMLERNDLSNTLEVNPTTIATDIQTKEANKGHAAEIYHEYLLGILGKYGIKVENFEVRNIGDSASDFPLHTRMDELGYRSSFYAVGGDNQLMNVYTTGHEDKIIRSDRTNGDYYDQAAERIFQEWATESYALVHETVVYSRYKIS